MYKSTLRHPAKLTFGFRTFCLLMTLLLVTTAKAVPRVFVTIDVESQSISLPEQVNALCTDGTACGLMEIARILKERGWAGTFFLNVYEYRRWGEPVMREIALSLQAMAQDVALHTHPQWAYDPARNEMFQYGLDEQTAIIGDGMRLLANWTGRPVVAHRAGDYSADLRTLEALERSGIRIDSSLFFGHPRSLIANTDLPRNIPAVRGKIIEIPVTIYRRNELPRLFGSFLAPIETIRKIDVDWFADENEARAAIDAVVDANIPIVVVFLHSFSLLEGSAGSGAPAAKQRTRDNFRAILDRVHERNLPVMTMRELAEVREMSIIAPVMQDVIPEVTVYVGLPRYVWHRLRGAAWWELAVWIAPAGFLGFLAAMSALFAVRRVRTKD